MYQDLIDDAASLVICMAILAHGEEDRITSKDLHKLLKDINEKSRIHVIAFFRKIGSENENENGWENLVLPLIEKSWSVEKKYRSESAVVEWVCLLGETGESFLVVFPELVSLLLDDIVSDSPSFYDRELVQILDQIKSANKELSFRKEFKRLRKIATREKAVWKGF